MRIFALAISMCAVPLYAQHSYSPGDVQDGERLFLAACAVCHGPDGNMVPGTNLARGVFRHASTDADLGNVIRAGIPGTAMPPHTFSDSQVLTLVAFLRSLPTSGHRTVGAGDSTKGKAVFDRSGCASCHRVADSGSRLGPDLSDIGARHRANEIEQSILDPDAEVLPQNRFIRVVSKDGTTSTGRILNQDAFSVQFMDEKERLRSVQRSSLKEFRFLEKSPMPSYRDKLSAADLADLVSYLASLQGVIK
jgi:putative heme-binding domain-containing protein